jgi:hypothetical protein
MIFIDANIYLRFFDSNQKQFKKLLDQLLKIDKGLFITNQIVDEVERNKLSVFAKSITNYKSKIKIDRIVLPAHFAMDTNNFDIINWNKKREELENQNIFLSEELEAICTENLLKISSSSDSVSLKLKSIFKNQIKESEEEYLKAKKRKETGNPPGKHNDTLGDQITWEQFLNKIQTAEEAWIISNDFDYFTLYNKGIYLNAFLYSELLNKNPNIKINCYSILSDGLKSYFEKTNQEDFIRKDELEEIKNEEKLFSRTPFDSSNLASVGYDAENKILEIEFNHGGVYQYFDVPKDVYNELMEADSHGKYFVHNVKDNFEYKRIK